ncbi:SdrD B-like domain-containing protein, partial [Kitasatospora sp. NRRL B-11411]|uniref:SdrD B-like domain-containing protein n=1 Tax=Kitasatospora sp. NRRL B-11411 TaxID=1463822 RepID=UPI0035108300
MEPVRLLPAQRPAGHRLPARLHRTRGRADPGELPLPGPHLERRRRAGHRPVHRDGHRHGLRPGLEPRRPAAVQLRAGQGRHPLRPRRPGRDLRHRPGEEDHRPVRHRPERRDDRARRRRRQLPRRRRLLRPVHREDHRPAGRRAALRPGHRRLQGGRARPAARLPAPARHPVGHRPGLPGRGLVPVDRRLAGRRPGPPVRGQGLRRARTGTRRDRLRDRRLDAAGLPRPARRPHLRRQPDRPGLGGRRPRQGVQVRRDVRAGRERGLRDHHPRRQVLRRAPGHHLPPERRLRGPGAVPGRLEVLCDRAPLQIGNRVWYDPERSGQQLPQQQPVPGATVHLYDADGKLVGTTKTTARGEYYFDDTNVTGGLKPRTGYTVRLDNPADYAEGGPLHHWTPAKADARGQYAEQALTTGGPGQDDHSFDFGFSRQQGALRLVKHDQDGKPLPGAVFQLWRESNGTDG